MLTGPAELAAATTAKKGYASIGVPRWLKQIENFKAFSPKTQYMDEGRLWHHAVTEIAAGLSRADLPPASADRRQRHRFATNPAVGALEDSDRIANHSSRFPVQRSQSTRSAPAIRFISADR